MSKHLSTQSLTNTCVFCLEDITPDDKIVHLEGCNHVLHSKCFFDYTNYILKTQSSVGCPICRHVVINVTGNLIGNVTDNVTDNVTGESTSSNINNTYAIAQRFETIRLQGPLETIADTQVKQKWLACFMFTVLGINILIYLATLKNGVEMTPP